MYRGLPAQTRFFIRKVPAFFGVPEFQKYYRRDDRCQRCQNIRKQRTDVVRRKKLGQGKGTAAYEAGRPYFDALLPAGHEDDQVHRNTRTLRKGRVRPTSWLRAISGTPATCAPTTIGMPMAPSATGHVGEQTNACCIERVETQARRAWLRLWQQACRTLPHLR